MGGGGGGSLVCDPGPARLLACWKCPGIKWDGKKKRNVPVSYVRLVSHSVLLQYNSRKEDCALLFSFLEFLVNTENVSRLSNIHFHNHCRCTGRFVRRLCSNISRCIGLAKRAGRVAKPPSPLPPRPRSPPPSRAGGGGGAHHRRQDNDPICLDYPSSISGRALTTYKHGAAELMSAELAGGAEVVLWSGEEVDTGLPAGLMERDVGMEIMSVLHVDTVSVPSSWSM